MMTRKRPIDNPTEDAKLAEDEFSVQGDLQQISLRPDGYYWQASHGKQEFGPFEGLELGQADMESGYDEAEPLVGETLQEAENEIGIADWIDPETGQPAEGQSRPHLEGE